jgi:hypothetical protein
LKIASLSCVPTNPQAAEGLFGAHGVREQKTQKLHPEKNLSTYIHTTRQNQDPIHED